MMWQNQSDPYGGGGGLFGSILGGAGIGGSLQDQQNMYGQQYLHQIQQQQNWAYAGFTEVWNFAEKPKPEGPEQYGPFRPPMPTWRYETSYAPGRENVWMAPLRDPGGRLLKVAAILGAYPAVYLVVLLLRGLLYAIL
jgi:hypothetical protein